MFYIAIVFWQMVWYIGNYEFTEEIFMQLTIDRFGRMVLPKAMRDDFGLRAGDKLDVEATEGAIVLRPVENTDCMKRKGKVLVFSGEAAGDVAGAVAFEREARLDQVAGGLARK